MQHVDLGSGNVIAMCRQLNRKASLPLRMSKIDSAEKVALRDRFCCGALGRPGIVGGKHESSDL